MVEKEATVRVRKACITDAETQDPQKPKSVQVHQVTCP